jgi:hypothetical protein
MAVVIFQTLALCVKKKTQKDEIRVSKERLNKKVLLIFFTPMK